jgi:Zn ribbon nucleic-acid-binding protein
MTDRQAQPLTDDDHGLVGCVKCAYDAGARDRMAHQAQPEMPTRHITALIERIEHGEIQPAQDKSKAEAVRVPIAEAMNKAFVRELKILLALFAKGTTQPNPPGWDDCQHRFRGENRECVNCGKPHPEEQAQPVSDTQDDALYGTGEAKPCSGEYDDIPDRKDCLRAGEHVCGKQR